MFLLAPPSPHLWYSLSIVCCLIPPQSLSSPLSHASFAYHHPSCPSCCCVLWQRNIGTLSCHLIFHTCSPDFVLQQVPPLLPLVSAHKSFVLCLAVNSCWCQIPETSCTMSRTGFSGKHPLLMRPNVEEIDELFIDSLKLMLTDVE